MPEAELARIQQAHHRRFLGVQAATGDLVGEAWDTFADLDDVSAASFEAAATVIVDAGKANTSTLAVAYMNANDAVAGFPSAELVPTMPTIRGGTPTADVYHRAIVQARTAVSRGAPADEALAAGRARAVSTAKTDINLANKAEIERGGNERPWVVGYRRILTGKSCAFCATASTQRYRSARLMPIHPNCDCDVGEIYGTEDPGRVINQRLLDELKKAGGETGTPKYWEGPYLVDEDGAIHLKKSVDRLDADGAKLLGPDGKPLQQITAGPKIKVETVNHGELGPVLTDARHATTTAADIAKAPRGKPILATDPKIQVEAARRGISPEALAARREAKRLFRLEENDLARAQARALSVDNPAVQHAARQHGVTPDEVIAAVARVPVVRKEIAESAARVQADAFARLYQWGDNTMKGPGYYRSRGQPLPGEYDWLERIDEREKARLSRKWFDNGPDTATPDVLAQQMQSVDDSLAALDSEEVIAEWLRVNREYEAAGSLRRGKMFSDRAYSGQIDADTLLPDISDQGYNVNRILTGEDLDVAGHIAGVERDLVRADALQYLETAAAPAHGPSPYRMSFQAWEEEVRELEYLAREVPAEMTEVNRARYAELVPRFLDEPGTSYEDLYARVVTTAERAGEEVPDHARIPWQ